MNQTGLSRARLGGGLIRTKLGYVLMAAFGVGAPLVSATLLLTGFIAYSFFPLHLWAILRTPLVFPFLGVNFASIALTLRARFSFAQTQNRARWPSTGLAASALYLVLHTFLTYLTFSLGL